MKSLKQCYATQLKTVEDTCLYPVKSIVVSSSLELRNMEVMLW